MKDASVGRIGYLTETGEQGRSGGLSLLMQQSLSKPRFYGLKITRQLALAYAAVNEQEQQHCLSNQYRQWRHLV